MSHQIVETCRKASQINYDLNIRKGNIIQLPRNGKVILTGDTHGHRRSFDKTILKADLANNPDTYIIFQEVLHGGPPDEQQGCLSFKLFFEMLEYQIQFPNQVFMIMGNHDTAIINDTKVLKAGREMNSALKSAMQRCFGEDFEEIYTELKFHLLSQPLAVKTDNGIWMSHSLPSNEYIEDFDLSIFSNKLTPNDLLKQKPVYQLTWGRKHSQEKLDMLAEKLGIKFFIVGHQTQETGWTQAADNLIILASDHNHGCMIAFDLETDYSITELTERIIPLASIE